MNILDAAIAFASNGCSVVPTRADGTKAPAGSWHTYQTQRPSADQITEWLSNGTYDGIGLVCGTVSGNLEMLELEGRAVEAGIPQQLTEIAGASGHADLWARITTGYCEATPSGGIHLLYRVDGEVAGNTKLARRPATETELADNPADKVKVLIETRGEGGYVIVAPSNGRTHPSRKAWALIQGSPDGIPTISTDERDAIHALCRMFDVPTVKPAVEVDRRTGEIIEGSRPGDDFNERATWADILQPHGWAKVYTDSSGVTYWRRPGKREGLSATTGRNDGDNLFVFTTSTAFEAEVPYSKFAAHTLLEHNGDYSAAAKQLRADGYGDDTPGPSSSAYVIEDPGEWAEPRPLGQQGHPPKLPTGACGPVLRPLVEEIGESLQVPTDLVINMALSVVATAAQGQWSVELTPEWTEILSISSTSVAASGERKSPILRILSTPLGDVEDDLREQAAPNVSWREEEIKLAEARIANARKDAQKDRSKEAALRAELESLDQLEPLHLPRLMADDATPEALVRVLDQQKGNIGILSAEPGLFTTLAGRYTNGVSNLDGVLKATSGEAIRVDRVGREPIHIEHPCLTVSVCIQPGLLDQLGRIPELRYAGLLARFLYVAPAPMVGRRSILRIMSTSSATETKTDTNSEDYEYTSIQTNVFLPSLSLYETHIRGLVLHAYSLRKYSQSSKLRLTEAAAHIFDDFRTTLEPRLHPDTGDLATIADWGSKLPGIVARIAGAMTLLENPKTDAIEEWTMADAIELGEAYIAHAMHVLDAIRGHRDNLTEARDVLRAIQRRGEPEFTLRDIHQALRNTSWVKSSGGPEAIAEQLDILTEYGYVRPLVEEPRLGRGRKPSPRFEIHPDHMKGASAP